MESKGVKGAWSESKTSCCIVKARHPISICKTCYLHTNHLCHATAHQCVARTAQNGSGGASMRGVIDVSKSAVSHTHTDKGSARVDTQHVGVMHKMWVGVMRYGTTYA